MAAGLSYPCSAGDRCRKPQMAVGAPGPGATRHIVNVASITRWRTGLAGRLRDSFKMPLSVRTPRSLVPVGALEDGQGNRGAGEDGSGGVAVAEVQHRVMDPGVGPGLGGGARPRVVGGLADVVLKLVEGLGGQAGQVVRIGVAVDAEVGPDMGAGPAHAVVALLAGESSLVGGVPQHAVGGFDVESGRDDGGEAVSEELGEPIGVHSGDYGGWYGYSSPRPDAAVPEGGRRLHRSGPGDGHSYVGV